MVEQYTKALIVQKALKYGLDPAAVLAVANVEGGIKRGAIGDQGTSFGPFQLHVGGALPKGKDARWANSPEGIDYAIRQMAQSGAKGLSGKDAVAAIVTHFERPANIPGEIAKAWGGYGQFKGAATQGGVAPVVAPVKGNSKGIPVPTQPQDTNWQDLFKSHARDTILQQSLQLAQTGDVNAYTQGLAGLAQTRKMFEAAAAKFGALPPNSPPDGGDGVDAQPKIQGKDGKMANLPAGFLAPGAGKIIGTPYQGTHTIGNWASDNAVDVAMPMGTPLRAMADGVIGDQFGSLGEGGRFAGLRLHLKMKGNEAYYAHLSKFAPGIKPGAHVKKGQIIGYSGEANGVTHLHLGVENGNPLSMYK